MQLRGPPCMKKYGAVTGHGWSLKSGSAVSCEAWSTQRDRFEAPDAAFAASWHREGCSRWPKAPSVSLAHRLLSYILPQASPLRGAPTDRATFAISLLWKCCHSEKTVISTWLLEDSEVGNAASLRRRPRSELFNRSADNVPCVSRGWRQNWLELYYLCLPN